MNSVDYKTLYGIKLGGSYICHVDNFKGARADMMLLFDEEAKNRIVEEIKNCPIQKYQELEIIKIKCKEL